MFLCSTGALLAQNAGVEALSHWFGQSREREAYRSIEPQLEEIFRAADSLSLPSSLLINRLNLGVARRLPPATLIRGMNEELTRLKTAATVLAELGRTPDGRRLVDSSSTVELLNAVSIYLSGGLSAHLLGEILREASLNGRTADEAFRGCAVLLSVERVGRFSDEELLALGTSLIGSSVSPTGYAAVGSFIVRAIATGRGGARVLIMVEQILDQGGGLPQMELELRRRR